MLSVPVSSEDAIGSLDSMVESGACMRVLLGEIIGTSFSDEEISNDSV